MLDLLKRKIRIRISIIPGWPDWDGDGKVDSREDMALFDQNNDNVADWMQKGTDEEWMYTENDGWEHVSQTDSNARGPTAKEIREAYDYAANQMMDADKYYTSAGIPKYESFDMIAKHLSGYDPMAKSSKKYDKTKTMRIAMDVHAIGGGGSDNTWGTADDFMTIHAEEYFRAQKQYVTAEQLIEFGWSDTSDEFVQKLNDALIKYDITDKASISMFMATMAHESAYGLYPRELGSPEYFRKNGYDPNEIGAGYIQITWRDTHLVFLKSMDDSFDGDDTASYIAENYPIEAAAWFWSSYKKIDDDYLNEYATNNGSSLGNYLVTQYYVNGVVTKGGSIDPDFNNDMISITEGGSFTINRNSQGSPTSLSVNGHTWRLPNGWKDREDAYNKAIDIFEK